MDFISQKLSDDLKFSLYSAADDGDESRYLNAGIDASGNVELILRTTQSLSVLEDELNNFEDTNLSVNQLIGGYAVAHINTKDVNRLSAYNGIIFIDKSELLSTEQCQVSMDITGPDRKNESFGYTGEGVLIAIIDSGVNGTLSEFYRDNGTSRIVAYLDMSQGGTVNESINVSNSDFSGHGTMVAQIAAGNGRSTDGYITGIAKGADLIVVRLSNEDQTTLTGSVMRGIDFAVNKAKSLNRPLVINLSYGNNYSSHFGDDIFSTYLTDVMKSGPYVICCGMGNEAGNGVHYSGNVKENKDVEFYVGEYETGFYVKLWKEYADSYTVSLIAPDSSVFGPITYGRFAKFSYRNTYICAYAGTPTPYSVRQQIQFDFAASGEGFVASGIWKLRLNVREIVLGRFDVWLPEDTLLNAGTAFLLPDEYGTLTTPAAAGVISVGAYDEYKNSYASFSGRGMTEEYGQLQIKPDVSASGVNVWTVDNFGRVVTATGTSFATPIVTGICACLMEWGIVKGNDRYMYGEKLRAYLRKYSKRPHILSKWPNSMLGWGIADVGIIDKIINSE